MGPVEHVITVARSGPTGRPHPVSGLP
ncbi:Hypothetical protein SCLAV_p1105 (plasmid) [Streptomyces clavuligerus]|uniref:Uncharacterized protein n=1 Tax=Streptomyces clavuligerus TaxID=1901 RepID=D5SKZ8_STRCL|nr:Hypothetical protein SCLAV_p1105 [Streptomyces clavuligerus]